MTGIEEVAAVAALAGSAVSAAGAIVGGNNQAATLRNNAAVSRINAGNALSTSEADAARLEDRTRRQVATASNTYGASGVQLGSGSPLDVLADQASQGALDSEIARWRGQTSSDAYLRQSDNSISQAGQAEDAGVVQAGTTLLTSGARYATSMMPRLGGSSGGAT